MRKAELERNTKETQIKLSALDGKGESNLKAFTFFVHMIDQLSKHGGFDIDLDAKGDLEVDAIIQLKM